MAAISKNVYFDVLDDIVNKYSNTVHRTIKMKPIEVMDDYYVSNPMELHSMKILTKKILNSKLVIMLEFQNMENILLKNILQIGQKTFWLLIKLKVQLLGLMLLMN